MNFTDYLWNMNLAIEEAENAALEQAKNSPQAKMLAAANDAAAGINMGDMEAQIQANIQAKIDSGASKNDILASMNTEEVNVQAAPPQQMS